MNFYGPQVGAASAYSEVGALCWARFAALLIGAIFVIAWLNLRYNLQLVRSNHRLSVCVVAWLT
jgi:hypothetical protein